MNILPRKSYFYQFFQILNEVIGDFHFSPSTVSIDFLSPKRLPLDADFLAPEFAIYIQTHYIYLHRFRHPDFPHLSLYLGASTTLLSAKMRDEALQVLYTTIILQLLFNKVISQEIYYFPTPFKKQFPKRGRGRGDRGDKGEDQIELTPLEVNSGLTYIEAAKMHDHKNGRIILFRREEHMKVLIHELIHSFHLDYSLIVHSHSTKRNICSNYPVLLNEAFTESFATLLHLYFVYLKREKKWDSKSGSYRGLENYIINSHLLTKMFKQEMRYELGLAKKILASNGLKYNELWKLIRTDSCLKRFQQQTNVFSYYLLKPLLLYNFTFFDRFMKNYTIHGAVSQDGIQILENYVYNKLLDQDSDFIRLLRKSSSPTSNSLRMVYNTL